MLIACTIVYTGQSTTVAGTAYYLWTPTLGSATNGIVKFADPDNVGSYFTFASGSNNQQLTIRNKHSVANATVLMVRLGDQGGVFP